MDIEAIKALNDSAYIEYHESLMKNNDGSSGVHVFFCIFFTVQCSIYSSLILKNVSRTYLKYFFEYIIIVLPLTLVHTILADYIYFLNVIVSLLVLYELRPHLLKLTKMRPNIKKEKIVSVSMMRALTHLITAFAILAVDFQSFPRYLAKTERYGFSLMDTGVGLFVLMSGLVHKDLRTHKLFKILISNSRLIITLLMFGIMRYIFVKTLNYQEHVTEYGTHWNFFITLAVCKLVSIILLHFIPNPFEVSMLLLGLHEVMLEFFLRQWVFSDAERDSFLSANREGIVSCLGYVSMYIYGAFLKELITQKATYTAVKLFNSTPFYLNTVQIGLFLMTVFSWILFAMVNFIFPASRTLANAAYSLYMQSLLITVLLILYSIEILLEDKEHDFPMPLILTHINKHGFWYFVTANVLTGVINMSIKTLTVTTDMSIIIFNWYMIATYVLIFGYIAILQWR